MKLLVEKNERKKEKEKEKEKEREKKKREREECVISLKNNNTSRVRRPSPRCQVLCR